LIENICMFSRVCNNISSFVYVYVNGKCIAICKHKRKHILCHGEEEDLASSREGLKFPRIGKIIYVKPYSLNCDD
jgi:hypothetical protein